MQKTIRNVIKYSTEPALQGQYFTDVVNLQSWKHPLKIYFLALWEYWLGLAKPKNVFRSILNPSIK